MPTGLPYLSETVYRFCTKPEVYPFFLQNLAAYKWIAGHTFVGEDDVITEKSFRACLIYLAKNKRCPESIDALKAWVMTNPADVREFSKNEVYDDDFTALRDAYEPLTALDDLTLFQTLLNETRVAWLDAVLRLTSNVAAGTFDGDNDLKKLDELGPTAAIQWLRSQLTKDFAQDAPALAGLLSDNTDVVENIVNGRIIQQEGDGRFPLGLAHLDKCVTVGKRNLRFIGVLGMSGDGKTTLTNQIVYNWLLQGAHILYVSTEHTPEEIWETMTFLHQEHPDYDFRLPRLSDWDGGFDRGTITREDQNNLHRILTDIKNRRNLSGLLDVQPLISFDAIEGYLTANNEQNRYDVLVVDYLARLDVPGDPRFRDQGVEEVIRKAQQLSRGFDDNKGLIILTPIQVNRYSNKEASNAGDNERRYTLNAVGGYNRYQHDLDLALTVWSDAEMRIDGKIEVGSAKERKSHGAIPLRQVMLLNRDTGRFCYEEPGQLTQRQKFDRTVEDVMAETSTVDVAEEWIGV